MFFWTFDFEGILNGCWIGFGRPKSLIFALFSMFFRSIFRTTHWKPNKIEKKASARGSAPITRARTISLTNPNILDSIVKTLTIPLVLNKPLPLAWLGEIDFCSVAPSGVLSSCKTLTPVKHSKDQFTHQCAFLQTKWQTTRRSLSSKSKTI